MQTSGAQPAGLTARPLVTVVIVNWNGKVHLDECLSAVQTQSYPEIETILVDNASIDGSVELVRSKFPNVRISQNDTNRGFCEANNQAIRDASGELLFLLNNDTHIAQTCIEEMVKILQSRDDRCIGCFPKVLFYSDPHILNAMGVTWHKECHWRDARVGQLDLERSDAPERVFGSIFPAVLLKRDLFQRIGMFDETLFSYCEDFDVCYGANALGYYFVTAPKAEVKHKYRSTGTTAYRARWQHYFFVRNYLYVILKNYSLRSLVRHFPYVCYRYLVKSALVALRGRDLRAFLMHLRAAAFLIIKAPNLLRARRFVQRNRVKGDHELWDAANVEHRNLFHHMGKPVLSLLNVRVSAGKQDSYTVDGVEYKVE